MEILTILAGFIIGWILAGKYRTHITERTKCDRKSRKGIPNIKRPEPV